MHQFRDPCPCLGGTKSLYELSLLTIQTNMFPMKHVVVVCTDFHFFFFFFAGFMGMMSVEC